MLFSSNEKHGQSDEREASSPGDGRTVQILLSYQVDAPNRNTLLLLILLWHLTTTLEGTALHGSIIPVRRGMTVGSRILYYFRDAMDQVTCMDRGAFSCVLLRVEIIQHALSDITVDLQFSAQ